MGKISAVLMLGAAPFLLRFTGDEQTGTTRQWLNDANKSRAPEDRAFFVDSLRRI
jgi:hypothetical protein